MLIDEVSLMAFDVFGNRLWQAEIEPPHSVVVEGDDIVVSAYRLNAIADYVGRFNARVGPPEHTNSQNS